jgi:hypothetical protein
MPLHRNETLQVQIRAERGVALYSLKKYEQALNDF